VSVRVASSALCELNSVQAQTRALEIKLITPSRRLTLLARDTPPNANTSIHGGSIMMDAGEQRLGCDRGEDDMTWRLQGHWLDYSNLKL
jgi:hypothetical protein